MNKTNILSLVRESAKKKILFLPHAIRQMSRPERMIDSLDVRLVVENGEIIENYPDNSRGHSCLILGFRNNDEPIHIVCSPKNEFLAIITTYYPDKELWKNNFKERKR